MFATLQLQTHIQNIIQGKICAKKVFDIIKRIPEIKTAEKVKQSTIQLNNEINFKDVHFRYPTAPETQPDTLQGVNFKIKAGTSTAIVGPSGSGKSTIVQMVERFYDPLNGTISFDGTNLKDVHLDDIRKTIGYVAQEPVLILGTIKENLMFANKDATVEDIKTALTKSNAEFVQKLESGLDTYIGSSAI